MRCKTSDSFCWCLEATNIPQSLWQTQSVKPAEAVSTDGSWATDLEFVLRSSLRGTCPCPPRGGGQVFWCVCVWSFSATSWSCLMTVVSFHRCWTWADLQTAAAHSSLQFPHGHFGYRLLICIYFSLHSSFPVLSCQTFKWWTLDLLLVIMKHLTVHYYPFMF